ncbi:hypothetical protein OR1_02677 [Geobacter sp. OR-1]|uniref:PLDc N-terminal domain-containing protein n=1 Tax=Geobacter sp. OR-1 TaxID=1266765 RepID=UPI000543069E|nr:PLDc N-terminal domain-containing protein [Geobacter sp. OR-1]GAM10388.1 hypothetical protein OR1_02677 [Geobacter sp. OR-1]
MFTTFFLMTLVSILLLPACIWLYALADVLINEFHNFGVKLIWLVLLCSFPPIATIFYYLIGRSQRITFHRAGKPVMLVILLVPVIAITAIYMLYIGDSAPYREVIPNTITI